MEAPAIRQRMTLSDQLSVLQTSSNLRDLLKFQEDDDAARRANGTITLATVLEAEKNAASSSSSAASAAGRGGRTLLDVIREEEESRIGGDGGGSSRWRDLTDRLRIRPAAATWTAGSAPTPARVPPETSDTDRASGPGTIRVSLMTLMELREREEEGEDERRRAAVIAVAEADGEDADLADEELVGRGGGGERHVCCVCMVRKKGAAFIPCGHTFCRVCSRELLMGRGNCPLCNAKILEVLDIF